MITNKQLADLIFPDITETIEDLEKRYPVRDLPEGAQVTRFAPSPTGFLHTGSLFTSLVCRKVASQSKGVFYVRLEDTDTKREIAGSGEQLLEQLHTFGIDPDEGYLGDHEEGNYGPYVQSKRARIYCIVIKHLLEEGKAYPCFCTAQDLEELRKEQEAKKLNPGYYGEFAKCRNLSNEEKYEKIHGKSFGGGITNEATIYNIKETNIFKNPIRLIDTSGVLDCRVPEWDKKILEDIENLFLSVFSHLVNYSNVGSIVLFLHMETDVFVHMTRFLLQTDFPEVIKNISGVSLVFDFLYVRVYVFGDIIRVLYVYITWKGVIDWFLIIFLSFIYLMHINWAIMLLQKMFALCFGTRLYDTREYKINIDEKNKTKKM